MKKITLLFIAISLFFVEGIKAQGATCAQIQAFCSGSGTTFPASFDPANPGSGQGPQASNIDSGNDYGCMLDTPNPAWYYLEIDQPGDIEITLTNSNVIDIDFILWGPFANLTAAIGSCGSLTAPTSLCLTGTCPSGVPCDIFNDCVGGNGMDCSFDPQETEIVNLPNGQTGEVYILLITNYANQATNISANQTGGTGTTNCAIITTPGSPCPCTSNTSCDGLASPDQATAVAALANAAISSSAPGCFDLTSEAIPGGDGNIYEFCYQYTHTSTEAFFAFSGTAYFTGPNSTACILNANTTITSDAYVSGACGSALSFVNVTSDGWPVYNATQGTTYELCIEITGDVVQCATETITQTCLYAHPYTIVCPLFAGNIGTPTSFNACFEDSPITLSVTNEITDASFPDIAWGVWVLDDPNGAMGGVPSGPLPPDQDPYNGNDPNFWGFLGDQAGGLLSGTTVNFPPFGNGATLYIAPMVVNAGTATYDPACTGLAPGYTIYMNPPLTYSANIVNCDATIDLMGGFPSIDATATYSWSVITPSGTIVTGTGDPINFTATEDGTHTFSIVNDGLGPNSCDLPDFLSVDFYACNCMADAGTFTTPTGTTICFGDDFTFLTNGDYGGSFEDGGANDQGPFGDGDQFNGVIYGVYSAPPTNENPIDDPNFIGIFNPIPLVFGGPDVPAIINNNPFTLGSLGLTTNTTYYLTSIYSFDNDDPGGAVVAVDTDSDGTHECSDVNLDDAVSIVFLNEVLAPFTQTCNAMNTVDITFTISGGLPALTPAEFFTVSGDGSGGTVSNNGTYTISGHPINTPFSIVVTDTNGCSSTFSGTSFDTPSAAVSSSNVTCNGGMNGTANVVATGGQTPYDYSWAPGGQNTSSITGQGVGIYTVTVTDFNGCQVTASTTIIEPPALALILSNTPLSCNGEGDGTATAIVTGGTPPYTYTWTGTIQTTSTVTGLSAGLITVTIQDGNGCSTSQNTTISEPTAVGVTTTGVDPLCFGDMNGSVNATASGGIPPYTYNWDDGATTSNNSGLVAGTYCVSVSDANGCIMSTCETISEPTLLTASTTVGASVSCNGGTDGAATATGTGGTPFPGSTYTYQWDAGTGNQMTQTAVGLGAGTYNVTVTDANMCTVTSSVMITEPGALGVTISVDANVNCNGESNGAATATVTGGTTMYSYQWGASAGSQTTSGATNLPAGTHLLTVTDANMCTITSSITITEPTVLITSIAVVTNVSCNGGTDGSATATGTDGTPLPGNTYNYQWDAGTGNQMTQTAVGLGAGTYDVTVTDANMCTATSSVTITEPTALAIGTTVDMNVNCNGGTDGAATVSLSGGTPAYSYQWGASSGNQTTATAANLAAGTHNVTVTDANMCTITSSVTISEPTLLTALTTVGANVSCNGGTDGSATATGTGGIPFPGSTYTYQWDAGTGNQMTQTAVGLGAGTYNVTVTDANMCTVTSSVMITEPGALGVTISVDANVNCNGESNGAATATVTGGTTMYSYQWGASAGSQTTSGATNLPAGTHLLTVTDANMCTITSSITITEPTVLITSIAVVTNVNCNGGTDGSATATGTDGTPLPGNTYNYQWDAGTGNQMTQTAVGLGAGTYDVTVTDANMCTATSSVTITEPTALAIGTTVDMNVNCNGGTDGAATVSLSGGTPAYSYQWGASSGNQTTATATNLAAGTHNVTVTDANMCTITSSVTISEPTLLTASTTVGANVMCSGGTDGSATVMGTNGSPFPGPTYDYQWDVASGSQVTQTAIGLAAGTYIVTVTDANNCTATSSATITEPGVLELVINVDMNVNCNGESNGGATASVNGGTPGYTYEWSASAGNQTTISAVNLPAGFHSLTVTDSNGCSISSDVTITEPTALGMTITVGNDVSCNGGSDGSASGAPFGGTPDAMGMYTYQWDANTGNQITATATGLSAGSFDLTVTDENSCSITGSVTITEPLALALTLTANINVSCNGGSDGSATAAPSDGTPGYTYQWGGSTNNQTTQTATGLSGGTHDITITDMNLCVIVGSVTITEPTLVIASTVATTNISCNGGSDGTATANGMGGTPLTGGLYTYQWDATTGNQTSQIATGLIAGSYGVTVSDANNCSATSSVTIIEPTIVGASVAIDNNISCTGDSDGIATVTATGGTLGYTYLWSVSAASQVTATANNLAAGTHSVTVTDANGCMVTSSILFVDPSLLTVNVIVDNIVSCNGGSDGMAMVTAAGGTGAYTYQWSASANNQTTQTASNLTTGTHDVTVTDVNGCIETGSVLINQPTALGLIINVDNNVNCSGGSDGTATAIPSGGIGSYTYNWNTNSGTQTTATATGLVQGIFDLTVTDANGCTITGSTTITEPSSMALTVTVDNDVSCNAENNGSATANPSGGTPFAGGTYAYQWELAAGSQNTQTATGLTAGTFSVTVTDANSCTIMGSVTVNEPTALGLTLTVDSNVSCNGGSDGTISTTVTGGTPGYTYQWGASAGNQMTSTAANLVAGTHFLTVTDVNGCTITGSTTVTEPTGLAATTVMNNPVTCNGESNGTATVNPVGGTPAYTYIWSAGAGGQTTQIVTGLTAGLYTVTVEDDNKCAVIETVTITESPVLLISITTGSDVSCNGGNDGNATAVATGGAGGFAYQWSVSTGSQVTQVANNLVAGLHTLTVTDANGCVATSSIMITEPILLTVGVAIINDVSCNGGTDGSIIASPNGGTPFPGNIYTYQWSPNTGNQVTQTAIGLPTGTYTVTVTDANGCIDTGSAQIVEPTPLTFSVVVDNNVSCFGEADGQATATAGGGTPFPGNAYTYQWSTNAGNQITPTAINLAAGTYMVTATDANGCAEVETVTITQPTLLTLGLTNVSDVSCFGYSDGSATANPTGGTMPYAYNWGGSGEVTQTAVNLQVGTYMVTVTDANNCAIVETFTIGQPSELQVVSVDGTDPLCNDEFTGSATVNFQGGTSPFNYVWSTGQVTQTVNILPAGNYTVTVYDVNGCSASGAVTLLNPAPITYNITTIATSCSGTNTCDGEATAIASGGVGTYTFVWDNGFVGPNAEFLCYGPHTVTITDDNGCTEIANLFIDAAPQLLPGNINATPVSCFGGNDGAVMVEPAGGTPTYTYTWTDASGATLSSNTGPSSSLSGLTTGVYTVLIEDANGCSLTPIPVTVNEPANVLTATAIGTAAGCFEGADGSATALPAGGTPSFQFEWDGNAAGQTTQTAFNLEAGTYFVTVTDNNGCETVASATVGEPTELLAIVTTDSTTCFGDENGSLAIPTVTGGVAPYMYSIDGDYYTPDTLFTGLAAGVYDVYVEDANGCIFMTSEYVAEPIEIVINAISITDPSTEENTIIIGDSAHIITQINLDQMDSTLTYIWTPPTDLSCSDCPNPWASPLSSITYTVEIIDSTGCSATDDITINVLKERNLFMPNVFTPNGDNINDIIYPFGGSSVTNIRFFHIYDRWGELVWKADNFLPNNPTFGWDGTFKGKKMNPGVFVYYLEVEFADGVVDEYKGDLTLVR